MQLDQPQRIDAAAEELAVSSVPKVGAAAAGKLHVRIAATVTAAAEWELAGSAHLDWA